MHLTIDDFDKRASHRSHRSDAMFWKLTKADPLEMGWLLEASEHGFAFAWRGDAAPAVGALIQIHLSAADASQPPKDARVRRVQVVHDDLTIIAGEVLSTQPAPLAVLAEPRPTEARLTPKPLLRRRLDLAA